MNRRDLLLALLAIGAVTGPCDVRAQAPRGARPLRIGLLPDLSTEEHAWFVGALRELGWAEGRDFVTIPTGSRFGRQFELAAKHMLSERPDLVVTKGTARALSVHRLTSTVPIVMFSSGGPVEAGLAQSLARPGKNVTGNSIYAGAAVFGKLLELLREAKPGIKRIGVFWGYLPPASPREEIEPAYEVLRQAARTLGLAIHIAEVASRDQLSAAMAASDAERPDALLVTSIPGLFPVWSRIMEFAVKRRLPTIVDSRWPSEVHPYPLMAYGASREHLARQTAFYVDRILKGARPGDLPIQLPAKFELLVSQKTAKAIGLVVPQSLLLRADEVIE